MNAWSYGLRSAILAGAALLMVACGSALAGEQSASGQQVTVQMSEFRFDPATVTVAVNEPVKVTVRNVGVVPHDWTVEGLGQTIHAHAQPGGTATVSFTPQRTGTFRIVCTQPGHEQAGMVGQLIVK